MGRIPDFVVAGAPKAGTSALFSLLRAHPELFLPDGKELHFFDGESGRDLDWYLAQFEPAGDRTAGEATPTYLAHATAIGELAALNPDVRLIVLLRDRPDRMWSHYHYGISRGYYAESFEAMVVKELAALLDGVETPHGLVHYSRYGHHLQRALEHVGPEQLLVLAHEDLEQRPRETFAAACRFLGVDETFQPPGIGARVNETAHIRFPRAHRALLARGLDQRLKGPALSAALRIFAAPGYPELPVDLRAALTTAFAADDRLLRDVIERTAAPLARTA